MWRTVQRKPCRKSGILAQSRGVSSSPEFALINSTLLSVRCRGPSTLWGPHLVSAQNSLGPFLHVFGNLTVKDTTWQLVYEVGWLKGQEQRL